MLGGIINTECNVTKNQDFFFFFFFASLWSAEKILFRVWVIVPPRSRKLFRPRKTREVVPPAAPHPINSLCCSCHMSANFIARFFALRVASRTERLKQSGVLLKNSTRPAALGNTRGADAGVGRCHCSRAKFNYVRIYLRALLLLSCRSTLARYSMDRSFFFSFFFFFSSSFWQSSKTKALCWCSISTRALSFWWVFWKIFPDESGKLRMSNRAC